MSDYMIECATKEEWVERALRAEAKLAKAQGAEDFWESCAVKNEKRWEKAEAKLEKAVEALEWSATADHNIIARSTLAELKDINNDQ